MDLPDGSVHLIGFETEGPSVFRKSEGLKRRTKISCWRGEL